MKTSIKILFLTALVATFAACSSGGVKTEATAAKSIKETSFTEVYTVNMQDSQLDWQGWKPTGTHNGTVNISQGELQVNDNEIVGGSFIVDMTSITVLDIEDPEYNEKLRGHLVSADFFEVETFQTATFVITDVKSIDKSNIEKTEENAEIMPTHSITGNLTMKGISKSITINANVAFENDQIVAQTDQFLIDRTDWNVQYGSKKFFDDLKDKFINDEMGITIKLTATAASQEMAIK